MYLPRLLDLADHVARTRMAELLVIRVVRNENGVAAERAMQRTADRPDRLVGETVVLQIIGTGDGHEASLVLLVDPLRAGVLLKWQRFHLRRGHQGEEAVSLDFAAALEPEVAGAAVIASGLERFQKALECELSLAGADRVYIALNGILGVDDGVDAAPHEVGIRRDHPQPGGHSFRQIGIPGHAGEADDVGAREPLRDLIDLLVAERTGVAHPARK